MINISSWMHVEGSAGQDLNLVLKLGQWVDFYEFSVIYPCWQYGIDSCSVETSAPHMYSLEIHLENRTFGIVGIIGQQISECDSLTVLSWRGAMLLMVTTSIKIISTKSRIDRCVRGPIGCKKCRESHAHALSLLYSVLNVNPLNAQDRIRTRTRSTRMMAITLLSRRLSL